MVRSTKTPARVSRPSSAATTRSSDGEAAAPSERKRSRPRASAEFGDEIGAAELARRVAESLRRHRHDRRLSLDELSARSGVSRAALSQIEGARTNPTLSVLWKIAVGLEIPFHDLLGTNGQATVLVLRANDTPPLRSADGRTQSRLLSPGGSDTTTEIYELKFQAKARLDSEPHTRGTAETLVVLVGSLRVGISDAIYDLSAGDSVYFRADTQHYYENRGTREARCIDVIHYERA